MALVNTTCSDSSTTVFTCSNAGGTAVKMISFQNDDASARLATIHLCPAGEPATAENRILNTPSIPSGDSYIFDTTIILANTDEIKVSADAASVVGCTVSYLDL